MATEAKRAIATYNRTHQATGNSVPVQEPKEWHWDICKILGPEATEGIPGLESNDSSSKCIYVQYNNIEDKK